MSTQRKPEFVEDELSEQAVRDYLETHPDFFERHAALLGRLEAGSDTGVDFRLNFWSSSQDSLLGGRQSKGETRAANVFHMNAVLRDRRSGKVLWQGDAYSEMIVPDEPRIARSMVRPLVTNLGRTVKGEPFELE